MDIISFNEASTANERVQRINANPDSNSGIVTVPKKIEAGESVTVPAGRVAVLPNVQVDGTLNVEGEVFIPSGATFGDLESQIAAVDTKANTKAPLASPALTGTPTINGVAFGGYSGFKNYIINGNFDVWQRKGKTQSTYFNEFTADRWKCTTVKDGVSHYPFLCSFVNNRANMPHNYMSIVLQDTNANRIQFEQRVEQSSFYNKNVGDYITISFYLGHNGTSFFNSSAVMELRIYSPTAVDNWTTATLEKTFTIGTIATMPEYGTKYTVTTQLTQNMISFGFNLLFTLYVPVGTAVGSINSTFRVSNVQLEEGSVATPFEQRPYGLELSLCQRYYETSGNYTIHWATLTPTGYTMNPIIRYAVPKRVTPTLSVTEVSGTLGIQIIGNGIYGFDFRNINDNVGGSADKYFIFTSSAEL